MCEIARRMEERERMEFTTKPPTLGQMNAGKRFFGGSYCKEHMRGLPSHSATEGTAQPSQSAQQSAMAKHGRGRALQAKTTPAATIERQLTRGQCRSEGGAALGSQSVDGSASKEKMTPARRHQRGAPFKPCNNDPSFKPNLRRWLPRRASSNRRTFKPTKRGGKAAKREGRQPARGFFSFFFQNSPCLQIKNIAAEEGRPRRPAGCFDWRQRRRGKGDVVAARWQNGNADGGLRKTMMMVSADRSVETAEERREPMAADALLMLSDVKTGGERMNR